MVAVGPLQAGDFNAEIVELQEVPHLQLVAAFDPEQQLQHALVQPDDIAQAERPDIGVTLEKLPVAFRGPPHPDDLPADLPAGETEFFRRQIGSPHVGEVAVIPAKVRQVLDLTVAEHVVPQRGLGIGGHNLIHDAADALLLDEAVVLTHALGIVVGESVNETCDDDDVLFVQLGNRFLDSGECVGLLHGPQVFR